MSERKHLVGSAAYWFNAAAEKRSQGFMQEALFAMENAYSHVENALAACHQERDSLRAQLEQATQREAILIRDLTFHGHRIEQARTSGAPGMPYGPCECMVCRDFFKERDQLRDQNGDLRNIIAEAQGDAFLWEINQRKLREEKDSIEARAKQLTADLGTCERERREALAEIERLKTRVVCTKWMEPGEQSLIIKGTREESMGEASESMDMANHPLITSKKITLTNAELETLPEYQS